MGYNFDPIIWFVCKLCRKSFQSTNELKSHKLESHLGDSLKIKCIIFEEKLLDHEWTPLDRRNNNNIQDPTQNTCSTLSSSTNKTSPQKTQFISDTNVDVDVDFDFDAEGNNLGVGNESRILSPGDYISRGRKTEFINPYVCLKPLSSVVNENNADVRSTETEEPLSKQQPPSSSSSSHISPAKRNLNIGTKVRRILEQDASETSSTNESDDDSQSQTSDIVCKQELVELDFIESQTVLSTDADADADAQADAFDETCNPSSKFDGGRDSVAITPSSSGEIYDDPNFLHSLIPNTTLLEDPPTTSTSTGTTTSSMNIPANVSSNDDPESQLPESAAATAAGPLIVKPFNCDICSTGFRKKAYLIKHIKTHSPDKPYECPHPHCRHAFETDSDLHSHLDAIHRGISPFNCKFCGKKFASKANVVNHQRTHTGERPFKCTIPSCSASFPSQTGLHMHTRRKHCEELELEQFACDKCGKTFGLLSDRNAHVEGHVKRNKAKPYVNIGTRFVIFS